jgi:hypothetical protein
MVVGALMADACLRDAKPEEILMTSHSHAQHRMPMEPGYGSRDRFDRSGRRFPHPRTVLVAFLVAVTIVVVLGYALRGVQRSAPANQPTAAWTGSQAPPGIWTPAGRPVK